MLPLPPKRPINPRDGVIKLHGAEGFEGMRKALAALAAEILDALVPHVVPGVTTQEMDDIVREMTCAGGGSRDARLSRLYAQLLHQHQPCHLPRHPV
jgi:hypothetical protein